MSRRTYKICISINSNKPLYYTFTVSINKRGRSCNTIDDPYAQIFLPDKANNINVKVFNLMSGVNEIKFLVQHEWCKCKYTSIERVCHLKQKCYHDKCRCECKDLDDWITCKDDYIRNFRTYDCVCKIDEYSGIKNCSCKKVNLLN